MELLVRIAVSAVLIGVVTLIAQANPRLAGWLAALPLTSLVATAWLAADGQPGARIADFYLGVLTGMLPTLLFLFVTMLTFRAGLAAPLAVGAGVLVWGLCTVAARAVGAFSL